MTLCERIQDQLPELIRDGDDALSGELRAHLASCDACSALRGGALGLGAELSSWTAPPASDDLVERTLANLALRGARSPDDDASTPTSLEAPAPAGEVIRLPQPARRRTSVEILTTPLSGGEPPATAPSSGQLVVRLLVQAAAAVALFGVSCVFVAAYYPAVVLALEEHRAHACQERLRALGQAVTRYVAEHPQADPELLRGSRLRATLIEGGYADVEDFACPAHDAPLGYYGVLPDPDAERDAVVYMDQLGNHAGGINVVYASGRVELLSVDALARLLGQDSDAE